MIMWKNTSLPVSVCLLLLSASALAGSWNLSDHELYSGDYNNDGLTDLYLEATASPQAVTIPYDISISVDVVTGNSSVVSIMIRFIVDRLTLLLYLSTG